MTKITRAVFPVAGLGTRFLPATKANPKEMLPVVDKPLIQYAVEEALSAGIKQLVFVTSSSKRAIEDHFDSNFELEAELYQRGKHDLLDIVRNILPNNVSCVYVRQKFPLGLGHAVLCTKELMMNEPFAVLLADDLIMENDSSCLQQMVGEFENRPSCLVAVEAINKNDSVKYGVVNLNTKKLSIGKKLRLSDIVEKPTPEKAPSNLGVVGRYILTPGIFSQLEKVAKTSGGEIQLTDAIAGLLFKESVYAYRFFGKRYDCGSKIGYLEATISCALRHKELAGEFQHVLRKYVEYVT